jgi:ABC-2 type transport system ATP-binding protein
MADAVVVEDLTRRFGDFTAVDAVSFDIAQGEVFGFLGPNGAGKTTTIRMLTGLLRPTEGRAVVAGCDVVREPAAVKRRIGYMSQKFSLYADLTVDENIAFYAGLYAVTGERLVRRRAWILETAALEDRRGTLTGTLPLGLRQRLALGCAVLHEPPVLFLDEPTSGVDPRARRTFWDLIAALADGGTAVLVSTHYMEEATACDRLLLMNRGRRIALDSPAALIASMTEPMLEVSGPDALAAAARIETMHGVAEAALHGRAVRLVVADVALEAGVRAALAAAFPDARIDRVEPGLEDVFTHAVRREGGAVIG